MFTRAWWRATAERALSTGAQFALAAWGGGVLPAVSLPWWTIPTAFASGVALTFLKCMAASRVGSSGPSLTSAEKLTSS